ncbi:MAG: TIGR00730 family Rossman fold protein [Saprospiraceae bacterium]|nr:TIGR00730 family Rossman fold protein [Saprospiraceae bacterium]
MNRIAVFMGSNIGANRIFTDAAVELGTQLAARNIGLVYGGGNVGLMGRMADAVLHQGGEVIGVIPGFMVDKELAHERASEMIITKSMHERKATMVEKSDAIIALPGGIGTLEELIEAYTWLQLRIIKHPIGILNTAGYYDPLIRMLDNMVENRFLKEIHRNRLVIDDDPAALLDQMKETSYSFEEKWHITES